MASVPITAPNLAQIETARTVARAVAKKGVATNVVKLVLIATKSIQLQ